MDEHVRLPPPEYSTKLFTTFFSEDGREHLLPTYPPLSIEYFQDNHAEGGETAYTCLDPDYVTSHIGRAHMMPRASHGQLIFVWPFIRAVDLLYDQISLCKVLRDSELIKQS